jgi:hypothetical protein
MYTNYKILESVPCKEDYFPMLHSVELLAPFYIADSISHLPYLIISRLKQNESLMRLKNQINKQIQALTLQVVNLVAHVALTS